VNVSPAVTDFDAVNAFEPRNVPAVDADQNDTCVYVSVVDTDVHVTAADVAIEPPEAAANVVDCRVVFPAAFDAPAEPGSPMCSFT